nr:hypothetical protein [Chloroflexia bacterium]
ALGNDHALAARACVVAGERALRLFANGEAGGFAERGARHVERLPWGPLKVETAIALLNIRITAATGPGLRSLPPIANDVAAMTAAAEALGLHAPAVTGHYLLSVLYQEAGDRPQAEQSTLRAARVGRVTDQATHLHQLANTARCLLELETQIPRTRALVAEAEAVTDALGIELCELEWARGLLHRWDGHLIPATRSFTRALALARHTEDLRREGKCLTWLAMLAFEQGHYDDTRTRCTELVAIATQAGDDTPCAMTMQALAALPATDFASRQQLDIALQRMRDVDDKSYLAYALNAAAELMLRAGDVGSGRDLAREALTASSLMRRQNDIAIAWALLARTGDEGAMLELQRLVGGLTVPGRLSARARSSVLAAAAAVPGIPTRASTPPSHT